MGTLQRHTRKESQQLTRTRLKQAALTVFATHGVRGSSIERITLAAGFSRGAFYANYKNKLELLTEILKDIQIDEVRYWRKVMETTDDLDASLDSLAERFNNHPQAEHRRLLSMELNLEACRNKKFEPIFMDYLDLTHREVREFYTVWLSRHGKSLPAEIDSIIVANRLIGLGLGTSTALGNEIGSRSSPGQVMADYLRNVVKIAPDQTCSHENV